MIKEKETDECDEDTEFTAPLLTAFFGRYDNESPPLLMFFLKITKSFATQVDAELFFYEFK